MGGAFQFILLPFLEIAIFIWGRLTGRFLLICSVDWRLAKQSVGRSVSLEVRRRARRLTEALAVYEQKIIPSH